MKPTDTHYYDNKISPDIITLVSNFKIDDTSNLEDLRNQLLKVNINKSDLMFYDKILKNNNNYDPINKLDVIKLLHIVNYISKYNPDILEMLKEQLKDLKSGFCVQGRSIRLLQLIMSYID